MRKGVRAYFTVEAVLVLPLVLVAIGVILYLLLYQYDRCVLEQDMGMLSVRTSSFSLPQEDLVQEFQWLRQGLVQEKYLMCTVEEPKLEVGVGQITVSGGLQLTGPLAGPKKENFGGNIRTAYESRKLSPLFVIRSCEKVKNTWCKGEE